MAERLASVPTSITGLWGEAAVVLTLRSAGCAVEWDGGMTRGGDMRAASPNGSPLHLQVKTSTVADGRIAWKREGQPARDWGEQVTATGATPLYVFVHFPTPAAASVDLEARSLTVTMPSDFLVTATTAAQFADDVDAARVEYGQRLRQRDDRFGRAGEPLSADGLQYPVCADDYLALSEVLGTVDE